MKGIILQYDYDYSELTEKPLTGGQQQSTTTGTTAKAPMNMVAGNVSSNSSNNFPSSINSSAITITNQLLATPESINATIMDEDSGIKVNRKCSPGYYRDNLGRCRRLRKPHLP